MNAYSQSSRERLNSCHPDLQKLFETVLPRFDHTIICGNRSEEDQDKAVAEHRSKTPWPKSKHNSWPSNAADVMPYPFSYADLDGTNGPQKQRLALERSYLFIGYVLATADELYERGEISARIRSGADWDSDKELGDQSFNDLPHFERIA